VYGKWVTETNVFTNTIQTLIAVITRMSLNGEARAFVDL